MNLLASVEQKTRKKIRNKVIDKLDENLITETATFQKLKRDLEREIKLVKGKFQDLKLTTDKERTQRNKGHFLFFMRLLNFKIQNSTRTKTISCSLSATLTNSKKKLRARIASSTKKVQLFNKKRAHWPSKL